MSRYNHKHKLTARAYLFRVFFSVVSIVILVAFMPNTGSSQLRYQRGEPWDDEPLIAQDSFPILKSPERVAREQDSIRRYYEPYFRMDAGMLALQQKALRQDFNSRMVQGIPYYFLPHLLEKLRHIYSRGVLGEMPETLKKEPPRMARIYFDNQSSVRPFSQAFTEKTAYEYITTEQDSNRYNHSRLHGLDLMKYITPNLFYDAEKSLQQRQEVDARLVRTKGVVLQGQKIVDKGQIVDEEIEGILLSLERHAQDHKLSTSERLLRLGGRVAYATILVVLLLMYFQQFRSDYLEKLRFVLFIMCLCLFFPIVTYAVYPLSQMAVYLIPYCMLPIFIRIFMDSRTAFVTHILTVLLSSVVQVQPFPFIVTQIVAGLVATFSLRELSQRSQLFRAAVLVALATFLTYGCMELVTGTFDYRQVFVNNSPYIYLMAAGVLSMLAYLLLIPIERAFGFTSIVTLVELQNVNNPLLRRLSEEATGTFNHSMQVANLAADVANKLGAKVQLVRTGALYHDIGKLENTVFFTENQNGKNPHEELPSEQSAQIIIRHVSSGLRLAEKYKLPADVRDFIATHHARSKARYFYVTYKNAHPDAPIDERLFTYQGPKPQTQEQAILMMADAVEAASRSLPEYTEENINAMVEKIVGGQMDEGSFSECAITLREIADAKEALKTRLRTVYHTRIQYPEMTLLRKI